MTRFVLMLLLLTRIVQAEDICSIVNGAKIVAQDSKNTYLGKIANQYEADSIFNNYGAYGGEYSSTSIWNKYSTLGSEYSTYSPFNKYTATPPLIIKNGKIIGYLSANKNMQSSVSPNILKAMCEDEL